MQNGVREYFEKSEERQGSRIERGKIKEEVGSYGDV